MKTPEIENGGPRCPECGYHLRGLNDSNRCPECGAGITAAKLRPILERDADAGDAVERSGLGLIAACTWCSALLLCGLILKPYLGGLILFVFLLASLARLQGWMRWRRGPILELGFALVMLVLTFGPWTIPMNAWTLVGSIGVLIGGIDIAAPAIFAARLGRRMDDPVLKMIGIAGGLLGLLTILPSLIAMVLSNSLQMRGTPFQTIEGVVVSTCIGTSLLGTAISAHLGRIAIAGLQSTLLESFIERHSNQHAGFRVGGAWISTEAGRGGEDDLSTPDAPAIPLSPRKPPIRPSKNRIRD
jgi:hypothetical protein